MEEVKIKEYKFSNVIDQLNYTIIEHIEELKGLKPPENVHLQVLTATLIYFMRKYGENGY